MRETLSSGGDGMQQRRRSHEGVARARAGHMQWRWIGVTLFMTLLLLAGCQSGSSTGGTGTPAANATTPVGTAVTGTVTIIGPAPTITPIGGPGGQIGSSQFCSQPPSATSPLPASIPANPNAHLQLSTVDGNNGIYGLCTTDSVSTSLQFYTAQLPAKGWQQLQQSANDPAVQLTATHGSAHVTITMYPDARIAGETDIIVQTRGQ